MPGSDPPAGRGHASPYPDPRDDPRPWWFTDFTKGLYRRLDGMEAANDRRFGSLETKFDALDGKVDELQKDRSTRQGVAVTWRGMAVAITGIGGMLTIIVLLITLIGRLPG